MSGNENAYEREVLKDKPLLYWPGRITNVRIHERMLSVDEVAAAFDDDGEESSQSDTD